jgi:hypothetical protein
MSHKPYTDYRPSGDQMVKRDTGALAYQAVETYLCYSQWFNTKER